MRWVESLPAAVDVPDELRQAECLVWLTDALRAHDQGLMVARGMRASIAGAQIRAWRKSMGGFPADRHTDLGQSDRALILFALRQISWPCPTREDLRAAEACLRELWHRGQK